MDEIKEVSFLGLKVSRVTVAELHDFIGRKIDRREKSVILYLNIHGANLAFRWPWLRDFFRQVPLVICDGDGIRLGLRMLGIDPPPKIGLTRWIRDLAGFSEKRGYRLFFLGARPGVAEEGARRLLAQFPGLEIAGTQHGYFPHQGEENEKLIGEINRLKPHILLVGFGMPLQEKWLHENSGRLDVPVCVAGGAVLDYAAGRLGSVPPWMIRAKLEWLFRIYEEPSRLIFRYGTEIPYFFWKVGLERLKALFTWRLFPK